ncbi:MAG TPA: hypothetical protein VIK97_07190, partial [Casimicrobiaceae bacterium]
MDKLANPDNDLQRAAELDTGVFTPRTAAPSALRVTVDESRRSVASGAPLKAEATDLNFYYGALKALKSINIQIREKQVTALIGPSGCG